MTACVTRLITQTHAVARQMYLKNCSCGKLSTVTVSLYDHKEELITQRYRATSRLAILVGSG